MSTSTLTLWVSYRQSPAQKFDRKYSSYIDWLDTIKDLVGYPDSSFNDMISLIKHKERLRELFSNKQLPKEAYNILQKEGILWV